MEWINGGKAAKINFPHIQEQKKEEGEGEEFQ